MNEGQLLVMFVLALMATMALWCIFAALCDISAALTKANEKKQMSVDDLKKAFDDSLAKANRS
jgi:hypothetical protein